ncbi:hypothetical protein ABZ746_35105 [Streptomyces sp. NPDC020096]
MPTQTVPVIDRQVIVPCTAVVDNSKSPEWIVRNSPTYTVRRKRFYTLQGSLNLKRVPRDGTIDKRVMWGVEKTEATTVRESVGLSVGFEVGAEFEGIGAKTTVSMSVELGYETMHSVTVMKQEEISISCPAPQLHTTGLYSESHTIDVVRNDADHTHASDNQGITFNAGAIYMGVSYPPPKKPPTPRNALDHT